MPVPIIIGIQPTKKPTGKVATNNLPSSSIDKLKISTRTPPPNYDLKYWEKILQHIIPTTIPTPIIQNIKMFVMLSIF